MQEVAAMQEVVAAMQEVEVEATFKQASWCSAAKLAHIE